MFWVLLMGSVIFVLVSVSVSLVLLVSIVSVVRLIILGLDLKVVNFVIVILRDFFYFSVKMMVVVNVEKVLWEIVVISVKKIIFIIGFGLVVRNVQFVIGW